MSMADNLSQLLATPLQPLAEQWRSPAQMNVADNCVDRWAEDPATADRTAVIWEGERSDVRTVSYAGCSAGPTT